MILVPSPSIHTHPLSSKHLQLSNDIKTSFFLLILQNLTATPFSHRHRTEYLTKALSHLVSKATAISYTHASGNPQKVTEELRSSDL